MAIKIYLKKGNLNYKERKMVDKIRAVMNEKMLNDPSIENRFQPATNFDELKKLHETYCVEDVAFEEIGTSNDSGNAGSQAGGNEEEEEYEEEEEEDEDEGSDNPNDKKSDDNSNSSKIQEDPEFQENKTARKMTDPLNREEPKVRGYVLDTDQSSQRETLKTGPERTVFEEPVSFNEAFTIPTDDDENSGDGKQKQLTQGSDKGKSSSSSETRQNINPNFDEMSGAKKKKSTKKFAKYIVETVCMLSEKGFVWYANKDINEAKLVEYEVKDEIDLQLLVTLEDGQEATVKAFFQQQCFKAEQLSKIDQEEKEDLIDALAEVLLEKGVAPTPSQELMMVGLKIFGGQVLNLIALKSQTNSLLDQLRAMKQADNEFYENAKQTRSREQSTDNNRESEKTVRQETTQSNQNSSTTEKAKVEEPVSETTEDSNKSTSSDAMSDYEKSLLDEPLETKE